MSLLSRLPWYGKWLLGLSVVFLIASAGVLGASITRGHTVDGSSSPSHREHYRWTGSQLQLEATERQDPTTCYVDYDGGGRRAVELAGTKRGGAHQQTLSFAGDATVACTRTVDAYTGSAIGHRDFSRSATFRGAAVGLVVVPLLFYGAIRLLLRAARG
jgi:hypothetical protein